MTSLAPSSSFAYVMPPPPPPPTHTSLRKHGKMLNYRKVSRKLFNEAAAEFLIDFEASGIDFWQLPLIKTLKVLNLVSDHKKGS